MPNDLLNTCMCNLCAKCQRHSEQSRHGLSPQGAFNLRKRQISKYSYKDIIITLGKHYEGILYTVIKET